MSRNNPPIKPKAALKSSPKPGVVELHIKVRDHYHKLIKSKELAGLPKDLARDTARRQIEHDHGIDVVRAALASNLDREETLATAGVASNAAQIPDGGGNETIPVDVKLDTENPPAEAL